MTACYRRLATALLALHATVAIAAEDFQPRIVNGLFTSDFATTGALLNGSTFDNADSWCSGTLIGCQTFLTAQHCVEGIGPSAFKVFLQHGGMFHVAAIALAPGYDFPEADIAVLTLATPVTGIPPARINTIQDPAFGSDGIIAGFGRSSGSDYGLKRYGAVTTASCPGGVSNVTSVCWDFDAPLGDPGSNSNTCNADSGGPLFLTLGGETVVAGVTSGGTDENCQTGDSSYDADVYHYRSFIEAATGGDLLNTSCGAIAQVGDDGTEVHAFSGSVSAGTPQATHSFTVPAGAAVLRVALNAIDNGAADFDLYVKAGSPPTTASFDCKRDGPNQFGVCDVEEPAADVWHVLVQRFSGSGPYQVTATIFGGGCGDPGNEGEPCDDGNPCTGDDVCNAGACQGSVLPDDTECSAGTLCTGPFVCAAGACVSDPVPRDNCKQSLEPKRELLQLRDKEPSSRDKLQWKWLKGEETVDFGDPTASTDYALCIYDESGDVPQLVMEHAMPAGPNWQAARYGYRYSDRDVAIDGIRSAKLKRGIDLRASAYVNGKGEGLEMTPLPLDQDGRVTVQLVNSDGLCWESSHAAHLKNTPELFKARGD